MGLAVAVAAVMERRGFHPLPWFVVALLLGPAVWPLAVVEAFSDGQGRRLLRAGLPRDGEVDVAVLLEKNEVPPTLSANLAEVEGFDVVLRSDHVGDPLISAKP